MPEQNLVHDWRWIVQRAWSFRLSAAASLLSGGEVLVQFLLPSHPAPYLAAGAALLTILACYARIICQQR